ncbi:MAG: heavy-metal-associated domain-containing protein [Anaerolineaceae bacterium]|nr:heavy-metal-associated domain-containing protein [Anaerolineaceae bacterium]
MATVKYHIPRISCMHCVKTIQLELGDLEGVSSVNVELANKDAEVTYDAPATEAQIVALLEEIGYPPAAE